MRSYKNHFYIRKLKSNFRQKVRSEKRKERAKRGYEKFMSDVRELHPNEKTKKESFNDVYRKSRLARKPEYGEGINYFKKTEKSFSNKEHIFESGVIKIPEIFSLIDNYSETSNFLNKLFNTLDKQSYASIILDYQYCKQIDVGASVCMDIMLSEFIKYYNKCEKGRHTVRINEIKPINYDNYNIKKILFSIGAFSNIRGFVIDFENILPFPIIIGNNKDPKNPSKRELDITKTVDYVLNSLLQLNKTLTATAETNFYKVIGEVLQNADEHSDLSRRYSIGYFENSKNGNYGIFNLAILNFGNTIYETFKNPSCENKYVLNQMKDLSSEFTKKGFFKSAEFEEETLWTLYSLQDGVTRIEDWDRGNGSIRFIENFFKLKGECSDDISKMVISSGHTRVIFNGEYDTVEKVRGTNNKPYKMMTFNESGNIEDKPDPKYVTFENNYFPGTLISARIRMDFENTEDL